MTTKAKALDRLIDAIAGEDVPMNSQTVAGRLDTLADTLAGDDVTFSARDIAGRISQLAGMIEDGTISIGGGGGSNWKPLNDGKTHLFVETFSANETVKIYCKPGSLDIVFNWGDGTTSNATNTIIMDVSHTYSVAGVYEIVIDLNGSTITFGDDNSNFLYNDSKRQGRLLCAEIGTGASIGKKAFYQFRNLEACFNVPALPESAFEQCYSIGTLTCADSVSSVGSSCFYDCHSLKKIELPSGVNSFGASTFTNCFELHNLTLHNATPPTMTSLMSPDNLSMSNLTIYVPAESVDAYKAATNWSSYASKIQAIPA